MMSLERDGVVAPDLTVWGVKGLSVNASIMPLALAKLLNATVHAIAGKVSFEYTWV